VAKDRESVRFGIRLREAPGEQAAPRSHLTPLEAQLPGTFTGGGMVSKPWQPVTRERVERRPVWEPSQRLLLVDSKGDGYDRALVYGGKGSKKPLASVRVDEWSGWAHDTFGVDGAAVEGAFKFRLNRLTRDGRDLELHRTAVYRTSGWTYPEPLAKEIVENVGPYAGGFEAYFGERESMGPDHPKYMRLYYEHVEQQCNYLADVAAYLKRRYRWDILITQIHVQDEICHQMGFDGIDPGSPTYDPDRAEDHWQVLRRIYQITDDWIGRIVEECGDPETLVVLISDHAAIPIRKTVPVNTFLVRAGLLTLKGGQKGGRGAAVDWSGTKAYNRPGFPEEYIWINVKGRDPQGVVEPGAEYDDVCDQVITALYSIRDPETGVCPIALALRKEDAHILGHRGDRASDILYFFKPGYTRGGGATILSGYGGHGNHSGYLPTAELGGCSNAAFFVMAGPGVRKGYRRPKPMWLVDVAPTISHLLGIEPPAQSEGAVLYDMLE